MAIEVWRSLSEALIWPGLNVVIFEFTESSPEVSSTEEYKVIGAFPSEGSSWCAAVIDSVFREKHSNPLIFLGRLERRIPVMPGFGGLRPDDQRRRRFRA